MCVCIHTYREGEDKNAHEIRRGERDAIDKGVAAAGKQLHCVQPMDDLCTNMAATICHGEYILDQTNYRCLNENYFFLFLNVSTSHW